MAGTYGDMQTRIADELGRSGLTSQIQNAILDSIKDYERIRFHFNETPFTFNTVANREYYDSTDNANLANLITVDSVVVAQTSTSKWTLREWTFDALDESALSTTNKSCPTNYALYGQTMRLYPIPNAVYTITVAAHVRLATLANNTDSNGWTTDLEYMIRLAAKIKMLVEVIRSNEAAEEAANLAGILATIEDRVSGENMRRVSAGARPLRGGF